MNTSGVPLRLWYARTGEHLENFIYHIDYVRTVVFSPDRKHLASGGGDSRLRLWDANTGNHIATLRCGGDAVAFSPDGKLIASAYGGDRIIGTIGLWDVHIGELRQVLKRHYAHLTCMAFSPDGKMLASSSRDSEIILWDMPTLQRRLSRTTEHTEAVYSVAFSPDGRTLAVAWGEWTNNQIQLLDPETLQPHATLAGHTADITDLTFSPDSGILAGASCDGTILLWGTQSEVPLGRTRADANSDGSVNIDDLTFVAARLGHVGKENAADINGDGVVDILDLVAVATEIKHAGLNHDSQN